MCRILYIIIEKAMQHSNYSLDKVSDNKFQKFMKILRSASFGLLLVLGNNQSTLLIFDLS